MLELEQKHREFEKQMEMRRQELNYKMEEDRRRWEKEFAEINNRERNRSNKIIRNLTIVGIILVIVEILAAIAAITTDSWVWKLFD